MSAIGKAFNAIGHGISDAVKSVGNIAEGIGTLNLRKAAGGLKQMIGAGLEVGRGAVNLSPGGLAANVLMGGKLDKLLQWADKKIECVAAGVVDKVTGDIESVSGGVKLAMKGLATGRLDQVAQGVVCAAEGTAATASNFTAAGALNNVKASTLNVVVGSLSQR